LLVLSPRRLTSQQAQLAVRLTPRNTKKAELLDTVQ
jgi:hypothetical protein